jgi:hypothetical protein
MSIWFWRHDPEARVPSRNLFGGTTVMFCAGRGKSSEIMRRPRMLRRRPSSKLIEAWIKSATVGRFAPGSERSACAWHSTVPREIASGGC